MEEVPWCLSLYREQGQGADRGGQPGQPRDLPPSLVTKRGEENPTINKRLMVEGGGEDYDCLSFDVVSSIKPTVPLLLPHALFSPSLLLLHILKHLSVLLHHHLALPFASH
jgi:hypothetical protein